MNYRKFDLEERLIDFGVLIIEASEKMPKTAAGRHLADQLLRSGTAPALIYGEAQAAESKKDFIHKMKVAHKELRETSINLRMLLKAKMLVDELLLSESRQLVAIFQKSIDTAKGGAD
ncbi:four helix bundle protein [Runella sp.]|uniref:four helix bundle protein n=1 Tax=Runella sp. TaxID=1960881 RepID=UPI003D0CFEDB